MKRAHTPPNIPRPGQPGDGPSIDLVAGDPPVPITVWRTPAGDDQASIPTRLAQRLVATYSRPGEAVIDLTDDRALTGAAGHGGRRHHQAWFTDTAELFIGRPTPRPPADAGTVADAASLVVACWPLHAVDAENRTRLRALLRATGVLLRPGGCLVLVVRPPAGAPAAPEDFSPLVGAARDAGLGYLQHIAAVRAGVVGDQFTYYATDDELLALARDAARWKVAHLRVHTDLLVFTPRQTRSGTGGGGRG